jgi:hypothetical protein
MDKNEQFYHLQIKYFKFQLCNSQNHSLLYSEPQLPGGTFSQIEHAARVDGVQYYFTRCTIGGKFLISQYEHFVDSFAQFKTFQPQKYYMLVVSPFRAGFKGVRARGPLN